MKLNKFDIGGEVISILTRGMYPDPRDAVREYIQNAVDAGTKNVSVKVRQSSVVVEDDGSGMDYETLRKAIRVGISDKNPKKNVGFMGIGLYSSFHLCNTLTIYTVMKDGLPLRLEMNFKAMRDLLEGQRELRLKSSITSDQLIDLQTLLENQIMLSDEGAIRQEAFPIEHGTRVELTGLHPVLDDEIADFDKLANYLRDVVPLHFDKKNFKYGVLIEEKIIHICNEHQSAFELVHLSLQVNSRKENLYRPYTDKNFDNDNPREPLFKELKQDRTFLGVAWGCLNGSRNKIKEHKVRGFILKKQGFSIGRRENLVKSFGATTTHFDRYIGEVILVHNEILPNAARNDLEYSTLRTIFYNAMAEVATHYNRESNKFQEETKAEQVLDESISAFRGVFNEFNPYDDNAQNLINLLVRLRDIKTDVSKKYKKLSAERKQNAALVKDEVVNLEKTIQSKIKVLSEQRRNTTSHSSAKLSIAKNLKPLEGKGKPFEKYDSLVDMLEDLDFSLPEDLSEVLQLIDEKFVQGLSVNRENYYQLINELKNEILNQDLA